MNTKLEKTKNQVRTRKACCDIFHDDKEVVIQLEMPGVGKEQLDVRVDGNMLVIHGSKTLADHKGDYLLKEIRPEDYHQVYALDDTIDREKISAAVKQGLVTLTLKKKDSLLPKKITIS
jgi:HSP20 family protein